jgi:hypothetical protein
MKAIMPRRRAERTVLNDHEEENVMSLLTIKAMQPPETEMLVQLQNCPERANGAL